MQLHGTVMQLHGTGAWSLQIVPSACVLVGVSAQALVVGAQLKTATTSPTATIMMAKARAL